MKMWRAESDTGWSIKEQAEIIDKLPLLIRLDAMIKIKSLLIEYKDMEWMAGLKGQITNERIEIDDITIYEQEGTGTTVELTDKGNEDMSKDNNIGWIHSHCNMGVFFSSTDISTASFNKISIVVNNKLEFIGKMKVDINNRLSTTVDLEITYEEEYKGDFIDKIKDLIKRKVSAIKEVRIESLGTDICNLCEMPIKKKPKEHNGFYYHKGCLKKVLQAGDPWDTLEDYVVCTSCGRACDADEVEEYFYGQQLLCPHCGDIIKGRTSYNLIDDYR